MRTTDDLASLGSQNDSQLVAQRGLTGGGRSIDGDPRRVGDGDGSDRLGQPTKQLVAGAVVVSAAVPAP